MTTAPQLEPIAALTRDLRNASATLGRAEARFLVDSYYLMQENRKRTANQARSLVDTETGEEVEPHQTLDFFLNQFETIEGQIKRALDAYSGAQELGQWARSIVGIGPVIAAGLLAHIDIEKAHTAGAVWRFAGIDPSIEWNKGEKRPFNADLKVLCWKIGDSFVKVSGKDTDFYGKLYRQRKERELKRDAEVRPIPPVPVNVDPNIPYKGVFVMDDAAHVCWLIGEDWFFGGFADSAAKTMATRNIKDKETRAVYLSGHLPLGRLDLRARRYAVKIFLAHYQEMGRLLAGLPCPDPYPLAHQGHTHRIYPPNAEQFGISF